VETKLKKGDIVTNVISVCSNAAVNESTGQQAIEAGHFGVVLAVRQTELNAQYNKSGKGDVYVDVMMSTGGGPWKAGNYLQEFFAKVPHATVGEA